jgi:hypothetical protein
LFCAVGGFFGFESDAWWVSLVVVKVMTKRLAQTTKKQRSSKNDQHKNNITLASTPVPNSSGYPLIKGF